MQRVDEEGRHPFLKQKPEDVVAVVSGSLKPYFMLSVGPLQDRIVRRSVSKSSLLFAMVNTSASTSPSELRIKQSCLSFATSIPTRIIKLKSFQNEIDVALHKTLCS